MLGLVMALGVSIQVALLLAVLISEVFLAGIDLGPYSLRVYLIVVLLSMVGAQTALSQRGLFRSKEAQRLFLIYLAFVLWAIVSSLYNSVPLGNMANRIASTHLIAVTGFLVTQSALKRRRDTVLMASLMAMTALVSGFVAIMQWFGVTWSWDLALMLHPGEELAGQVLGTLYGAAWGFVPGLAFYSIPLSYHLLSFGMLIFS